MRYLKETYPVLVGAIILSIVAFYNGYPLVYSDTGTYIASGWDLMVPIDRPIAYGLFIRFFGSISLWPVVLMQNLITSFILFEAFKIFFTPDKKNHFIFYSIVGCLTFLSGIAWYSNQIMPDFLTPLLILSIFLLFYHKQMSKLKFILISGILIFTLVSHFSHLMIASIMALGIAMANYFYFKKRHVHPELFISWKRVILVSAIAVSGWLALPILNSALTGEFYNSKSSHVFLMASTAEKGILERFLKDKCKKPEYSDCKLCKYQHEIPTTVADFIWGGDSSVFIKTGGWYNSKQEYDKILGATLRDPKYLSQHLYKSFAFGLSQLMDNGIGEGLGKYREASGPYMAIHHRYHIELNMYLNSKQNKSTSMGIMPLIPLLNNINIILLIFSVFFLIYIYFSSSKQKLNRMTVLLVSIMFMGIIINSFVTAGLSAPYSRYQTRVVWLIEFAIMILTIKNWDVIKGSIYSVFKRPD